MPAFPNGAPRTGQSFLDIGRARRVTRSARRNRVTAARRGALPMRAAGGRPAGGEATAPTGSGGLADLLARARSGLTRLTPEQAAAAGRAGALLVDIRTAEQRAEKGALPGAICIDRTVLEWRLEPGGRVAIPEMTGPDTLVILICRQGYSSSLAAASLQAIGLRQATDVIGGVEGWIAAGLPISEGPADVRS